MVRRLIFNDEITLWWEYSKAKDIQTTDCFLNGEKYAAVASTHVTFKNLTPDTEYQIRLEGDNGACLFDGAIRTQKAKNKIDVSLAPYNAVGDGVTLNTQALQRALDDCTEGDYVYIPVGTFLSGALRMRSNTELYVAEGAVLQGSQTREDYLPKIKSRFEGLELTCYSSLINAGELDSKAEANCFNIVIRGGGRIVGGGNPLRSQIIDFESERLKDYIEGLGEEKRQEFECSFTLAGRFRPRLINLSNVENAIISGVSIESSPSWNLHMVYSKNLTVYNCKFLSHDIHNGDGVDPDSVENCAIFDCSFDTSDDCIAIKSGRNPEGNVVNRRSADIYVFDCRGIGHSICVGSEMSGGVENVYVWDCDMREMKAGFQLKFHKKRGGYIKNVRVNRCATSRVCIWSATYNNDGEGAPTVSQILDVFIEDCAIYGTDNGAKYVSVVGIDGENPVKNVYFNNVTFKKRDSDSDVIRLENVENVLFNKISRE